MKRRPTQKYHRKRLLAWVIDIIDPKFKITTGMGLVIVRPYLTNRDKDKRWQLANFIYKLLWY